MKSAGKKYLVAGALCLCCTLTKGEVNAASETGNEFLDMDLSQLMNITITSVSKKEQRLADAAAAVFVISQEDIRRSGVTSIPDALAMAPGLQVAKISASKWSVSSRGFAGHTSNKLLVLIDGRSVYSPSFSGTWWDMQNTLLEDIDRIEVIRGPGGTLWGANAVNGIINIITKKSSETHGGLVRVGAGDQERYQGGVRYGAKLNGSTDGRIYLTYNDRDNNTLANGGGDANDSWQSFQGGFRLDGTPRANSEWTLQGDMYRNRADQILYPYWIATSPYLTAKDSEADMTGANILGRYRRELSGGDAITVQAYYDYNDQEEHDYYQQTFKTVDLDIQYETSFGAYNSFTIGGGYRRVDGEYENSYQVEVSDTDTGDDIYSTFVQDEIKLIDDKLWLTLGTKWEHNDFTGSELQPSGRLLWKPVANHSFWASVARAVRTPSIVERKGSILAASYPLPPPYNSITGTTYIRGNKEFDSEEVVAYETGYRWQANTKLSFDIAAFYNEYEKLYQLEPVTSSTGLDFTFVNGAEGHSYGLELAADWKPTSWLSLVLTYSYLDMELSSVNSLTGQNVSESTLAIAKSSPKHQASVRTSIDFAEKWQTNLWLRYTDEIVGRDSADVLSGEIPLDGYFLFDANLIWKATDHLEIMLVGQNLLNNSQLEYISELITPATEIERSVYLKLTYNF
ncbi:TonB-dependent siderophore receptor [Desulfopila sp. IMCC35006]|uniref:TonB-dependent receptor plug domain-containing protein n=1 Tax=Desulfopila sp. IMCC35006 TaxID=2569542 RepID=UPI00142ED169|nr:TonB-dependent receptor [Desulfopila sp. IMCC35006]